MRRARLNIYTTGYLDVHFTSPAPVRGLWKSSSSSFPGLPRLAANLRNGHLVGWTPEALAAAVAEHDAVLCDIRFMPRSRVPGWNRVQLERLMGARYRHLKILGNSNYKSGEIALVDLAVGLCQIKALLDQFDTVVLMCACRDVQLCHRRLVADEANRQLGIVTTELRPPPGPQMKWFGEGMSA